MRATPRLTSIALAAAAVLILLACGGDEDLQAFVRNATPATPAGAIQRPSPTATAAAGASGSIARDTATPSADDGGGGTGAISGVLSYPSEMIPPLRVVALSVDTGDWYAVDTEVNQRRYAIEGLPPGTYHVVAYLQDASQTDPSGGYSQFIPCGATADCTDHALLDVSVTAGNTTEGIDPGDWYAPAAAFPPDPTR